MSHLSSRYHAVITTEERDPQRVYAMLRLRKRLFVDLCGWQLATTGDIERDEFDTWYAEHCLLFSGPELVGGFRAIRTEYPYLTKSVFPQLAVDCLPSSRDIWEISRFGVAPGGESAHVARLNYSLMFRFAELRGAEALVAMADLTYERFLTRMGIRTRRYGPPQVIGHDRVGRPLTALAGNIPLDLTENPGLTKFLNLARQLEIHDATYVLGRSRVSARPAPVPA